MIKIAIKISFCLINLIQYKFWKIVFSQSKNYEQKIITSSVCSETGVAPSSLFNQNFNRFLI